MHVVAGPGNRPDAQAQARTHQLAFAGCRLVVVAHLAADELLEQPATRLDTDMSRCAASIFARRTNSAGIDSVMVSVAM